MGIFIIIIVLVIIWLFTSTSKSEDVKTAIKFAKEAKDETNKFLDELNSNLDEFNKNLEESVGKYSIESKKSLLKKQKEYLIRLSEIEDIDSINESIQGIGLDLDDTDYVTSIVEDFKEAGRYEEISHLVIKKSNDKSGFFSSNNESYVPNYDFGRQERDRAAKEKLAEERLAKEKLTKEKLAKEKLAKEKLAKGFNIADGLKYINNYVEEIDS